MECPLRAHYHYDLALPATPMFEASSYYGQCVHESLDYYYRSCGDLDGAVSRFKMAWAKAPGGYPKRTSFESYRTRGIEALQKAHLNHRWQTFVYFASEHRFLVPFGRHQLTGVVDLLGTERSGTGTEILKVVDHKTATKLPTLTELALNSQFTVYLWAVKQPDFWTGIKGNPSYPPINSGAWYYDTVAKMMPARGIWHQVGTGREIDVGPRTERDFARLYRVCCEIEKAVNANVHVPKIGPGCEYCDYQAECELEIPVSIAAANNPDDQERWV
jgi:hypothetical protein